MHMLCWGLLAALALFTPGSYADISEEEAKPLLGKWHGTCQQRWYYAPTNNPALKKRWSYYGGVPICTEKAFEYPYTVVIQWAQGGLQFRKSVPDTKFKVGNKQYTFPNHASPDTETRNDIVFKYGLQGNYKTGWACTDNWDDNQSEFGFRLTTENGKQVYYEATHMYTGGEFCYKGTKITCNPNVVPAVENKGNTGFGTTVCKLYKVK